MTIINQTYQVADMRKQRYTYTTSELIRASGLDSYAEKALLVAISCDPDEKLKIYHFEYALEHCKRRSEQSAKNAGGISEFFARPYMDKSKEWDEAREQILRLAERMGIPVDEDEG